MMTSSHTHSSGPSSTLYPGAVWNSDVELPLSRWTDPVTVRPGTRVIVRRKIAVPGATGPHHSDIIGTLTSVHPLIISNSTGQHTLDRSTIAILKSLSAHPVRTADIRAVETAAALAFPGINHATVQGWYARASDGITERSNSAAPLSISSSFESVPIEELDNFYQHYGVDTQLLIPERIGRPAQALVNADNAAALSRGLPPVWSFSPAITVMTKNLNRSSAQSPTTHSLINQPSTEHYSDHFDCAGEHFHFSVHSTPRQEWFGMYHFRGIPLPKSSMELLSNEIPGTLVFAQIKHNDELVAITRGTITHSDDGRAWLGYSAVEVAPAWRQRGLGTQMGIRMVEWGRNNGADEAYLHVQNKNLAGRNLYLNLGFSDHHKQQYARRVSNR